MPPVAAEELLMLTVALLQAERPLPPTLDLSPGPQGPLEWECAVIFLFITQPSGLLSQKDFSTSASSAMGGSVLADLFSVPLTFSIAASLAVSQISAVSSVETTPVRRLSESGAKYSGTNFPSEISVPFESNSQSLFTERALLISSCNC